MAAEPSPDPCPLCALEVVHVVIQRKPLRSFAMPEWVKLALRGCYAFLRWVNGRYGFAASDDNDTPKDDFHSLELKGVYADEAEAWHAANCDGAVAKPIPWRASLPSETVQFESELWPALDGKARHQYKDRKLEIVSFRRSEWERLEAKAEELVKGRRVAST